MGYRGFVSAGLMAGLAASAASAGTFSGLGTPADMIADAVAIDFSAVPQDIMPTSGTTLDADPRLGARTQFSTQGMTVSGYDTINGTASAIYATDTVSSIHNYSDDPTVFEFAPYTGFEFAGKPHEVTQAFGTQISTNFNTTGTFLTNLPKKINSESQANGGVHVIFQPVHTNQFRFDFDAPVNAFGLNFGANDAWWMLSAYDAADNLLEEVQIDYTTYNLEGQGEYYGITAENIAYVTLTDTFLMNASAGGPCFPQIPGSVCGEWVMIDNVTYGFNGLGPDTPPEAPAVPLPAPLPLLAAGLLGMAGLARRRRG